MEDHRYFFCCCYESNRREQNADVALEVYKPDLCCDSVQIICCVTGVGLEGIDSVESFILGREGNHLGRALLTSSDNRS